MPTTLTPLQTLLDYLCDIVRNQNRLQTEQNEKLYPLKVEDFVDLTKAFECIEITTYY